MTHVLAVTYRPMIAARRNIWGNWACKVGSYRVTTYATEFDAQQWIDEQHATGRYRISPKSDLQPTEKELK